MLIRRAIILRLLPSLCPELGSLCLEIKTDALKSTKMVPKLLTKFRYCYSTQKERNLLEKIDFKGAKLSKRSKITLSLLVLFSRIIYDTHSQDGDISKKHKIKLS